MCTCCDSVIPFLSCTCLCNNSKLCHMMHRHTCIHMPIHYYAIRIFFGCIFFWGGGGGGHISVVDKASYVPKHPEASIPLPARKKNLLNILPTLYIYLVYVQCGHETQLKCWGGGGVGGGGGGSCMSPTAPFPQFLCLYE